MFYLQEKINNKIKTIAEYKEEKDADQAKAEANFNVFFGPFNRKYYISKKPCKNWKEN